MDTVTLTIKLTGPSADEVADEIRMEIEDCRDSGDYDFESEVEQADACEDAAQKLGDDFKCDYPTCGCAHVCRATGRTVGRRA